VLFKSVIIIIIIMIIY